MKTRLLYFCLYVILACPSLVLGQEFAAKGVVIDKSTKSRIVLSQVSNKRTGVSVGTGDMGFFSISASVGDTLIIQKRNYAPVNVAVAGTKDIVIYLVPDFLSIEGVVISGQSKQASLDEIKQEYKNKGSFYGGKPPFLSFLFSPITALYETFGRTPRNARRFGKYYATEIQQSRVDGLFSPSEVRQQTGLDGKMLEDFMLNYRPDASITEKWTTYDAIKYIKASYKSYTDTLGKKR